MSLLRRLKRFLVHPAVVLVLLGLLALAFAAGQYLPERLFDPAAASGPRRVLTTHLPAALVVVALASLALATWDIGRTAWARTVRRSPATWRTLSVAAAAAVERTARRRGFVAMPGGPGRLVRHPWSLWANFLLHAGMLLAAVAFQLYAATERQGVATLVEGESVAAGADLAGDHFGPLAAELDAPVGVRLERVEWKAGPDGALVGVDSTLVLELPGGPEAHELSPNDSHAHWDYRLYHGPSGHAFVLHVAPPGRSPEQHLLQLALPAGSGQHSYADFELPALGGTLRAKYRVAEFPGGPPELTVRLVRGPLVVAQAALVPGVPADLAGAAVTLVDVRRWSSVLFDAGRGMLAVLAGFAMTVAGVLLLYLAPPRELVLEPGTDGAVRLGWSAWRDRSDGELEALLAAAGLAEEAT